MRARFSPSEAAAFAWNAGAHKRWARVFRGGEWWWELGGDWGQGVAQGLVLAGPVLEVEARVDLSSPTAGGVSWAWAVDVLARRGGVDGLGLEADVQLSVGLSREALEVSGRCVAGGPRKVTLPPGKATSGPRTVSWKVEGGSVRVALDGEPLLEAEVSACLPGVLMLGAGANGSLESNTRVGTITVDWR
ncbi:MAG: hypothetical protein RL653_131 [Pseudomonadota bacterium]|jgi:hypothetical protein